MPLKNNSITNAMHTHDGARCLYDVAYLHLLRIFLSAFCFAIHRWLERRLLCTGQSSIFPFCITYVIYESFII